MAGLANYDCDGVLTIGGISMNRPAWGIVPDENGNGGLLQLLTTVDIRGDDRIVPGVAGVIPYRRRITRSRYVFRLVVTGDVDETGAENADSVLGLVDNLDYLWDNVIEPPSASNSLLAASWTPPGSSARTADIHVVRCDQNQYSHREDSSIWIGSLTISVPEGRFS